MQQLPSTLLSSSIATIQLTDHCAAIATSQPTVTSHTATSPPSHLCVLPPPTIQHVDHCTAIVGDPPRLATLPLHLRCIFTSRASRLLCKPEPQETRGQDGGGASGPAVVQPDQQWRHGGLSFGGRARGARTIDDPSITDFQSPLLDINVAQ